jgi:hypothetical protein
LLKNTVDLLGRTFKTMFIKNYFEKTKTYTLTRFIIESSIISFIGKLLVGLLIAGIIVSNKIDINTLPKPNFQEKSNTFFFFIWLCITTPIIETVISQWLPIILLQKITSNITLIISIDALLFTFAHWWNYGFIKMFTILPVGIILAWSFILNNKKSFLKALYATATIHAILNFTTFLPSTFH